MNCNMCGACCTRFSVPRISIYNYRDFLKTHTFLEVIDWGGTDKCMIPVFKCTRLKPGPNNTQICSNYRNRPDFCVAFPQTGQRKPAMCSV